MRLRILRFSLLMLTLLLSLLTNPGCQPQTSKKITNEELATLLKSCPDLIFPIKLYYLDGDCSFCLAKAAVFDQNADRKDSRDILIFKSSNPLAAEINLKQIILRSCPILDSNDIFSKTFSLNTVYTISDKGEILSEKLDKK